MPIQIQNKITIAKFLHRVARENRGFVAPEQTRADYVSAVAMMIAAFFGFLVWLEPAELAVAA